MLFMFNQSPLTTNKFRSLLKIAPVGAPILLYEDGVISAMQGTAASGEITAALTEHPIYAVSPDLEARGIKHVIPGIQLVDYDGFVGLVEKDNVVPWI
jgi:tRNA 2-thiouridine synthesizing protein B